MAGAMATSAGDLTHDFKQAMRRVASTVNVITVCVGGEPMGITATAMSSLSLDPPSLLICINRTASLHSPLEDVSHFCVNVLHRSQEDIAAMFADQQPPGAALRQRLAGRLRPPAAPRRRPGGDLVPANPAFPLRHPLDLRRRGRGGGGAGGRRSARLCRRAVRGGILDPPHAEHGEGDHAKHGGGVEGREVSGSSADGGRPAPATPPPPFVWSPSPSPMGRHFTP